jgi:diguanylate cyclase (GGDEF)-like protein
MQHATVPRLCAGSGATPTLAQGPLVAGRARGFVTTETIFILVSAGIAGLLLLGALVAALRARSRPDDGPPGQPVPAPVGGGRTGLGTKYEALAPQTEAHARGGYRAAVRVAWWVTIASVMVGIGVVDGYPETRSAIYLLGGVAVAIVIGLHELLPAGWRGAVAAGVEIAAALVLATGLLVLTGYGTSPFVYAYHLLAVAVALSLGGRAGLVVGAAAALAYLAVVAVDPARSANGPDDLLRLAVNVGSLLLLAYLAGIFSTGERRMRRAVLELSQIDPLTGLFNRSQLHALLTQEVQRTRRSARGFCVLMVDLDGLKAVNDSFGHQRGDDVLRAIGDVIRRSIRTVDSAYRYGGDEFLVLLPETDYVGAFVVAEKVKAGSEDVGLALGDGELLTSVSIGLVSHPEDGGTVDELVASADRAMYHAKALGKNQISGNPRGRRVAALPPGTEPEPAARAVAIAPLPGAAAPAGPPTVAGAGRDHGTGQEGGEDDEPDPGEVRRQIAVARGHMDPDHQIRRAMDAFLSPARRSEPD